MIQQRDQEDFLKGKRIALVHDFLMYPGGAEKVLVELMELFPHAPIFTLLYDREGMSAMGDILAKRRIHTSFLQKFPRWCRRHMKWLVFFMPTAPETFDLRDYDIVISSSGAWSKGIVTRVSTIHIAYIHSPMRFVWDENIRYAQQRTRKNPGVFLRWLLSYLRVWDFEAAQRPDVMIANSQYTQKRIEKFYRRTANVVYPPVHVNDASKEATREREYFLVVARLSEYKNVELAIDVCTRLDMPLRVVGAGRMEKALRKRASGKVQILGWQSKESLQEHYRHARAVLFPSEEDFGIVMAEALAYGTPVIAYGRGGACEIIEPGKTGELFYAQTQEVLADGIRRFIEKEKAQGYDKNAMRERAMQFSREAFRKNIRTVLKKAVEEY